LSRYDETRWYGYRLDNIQNWQKITWDRFSREAKRLRTCLVKNALDSY
jgi:hypothetical protein